MPEVGGGGAWAWWGAERAEGGTAERWGGVRTEGGTARTRTRVAHYLGREGRK
jgi:hypothetical protein